MTINESLAVKTAAELADAIDVLMGFPGNSGGASLLGEAVSRFAYRYGGELLDVYRAFSDARFAHKRAHNPGRGEQAEDEWAALMKEAARLSELLRAMGDARP